MKNFFAAILVVLFLTTFQFAQSDEINIIPKPQLVDRRDGYFEINPSTRFFVNDSYERALAVQFNSTLEARYKFKVKIVQKETNDESNSIQFSLIYLPHPPSSSGSYSLSVDRYRIGLIAPQREGLFYAFQTLLQMLPSEGNGSVKVSAVGIKDWPRFQYRGMHLDVARHFQPVEFVKKFIDQMSQYKFNYFHWHLTDDQGWRTEIKKWPKLTEIGSKRPETMKDRNFAPYIGDGAPHGGFYTQEQIKDVVAYAKARHITVVPEIELPGHASAALAAYPQFGCKPDYQYKVQTTWGIFKETFCPTDETFKFLEDVLTETIALFPDSPYIHIGGDEVLKDHWKESAFVQELKKKENLKDEHEVQSYFVQRMERFVNSKGKKIIGWDEILEGGLAPNATVMSWRGMKGGIEAAKSKHDVIMTPTDYVYFDYGQGDPAYEPLNIGSYVALEKVYSFEPVPPELTADEAKYVIGGQANIWTEYIKTPRHVEYMAFPRMLALSEVLWSKKEDRDLADFNRRLWLQFPRLDKQNVNYRIPEPWGLKNIVTEAEKVTIDLMPQINMREILFTTDGTTPTDGSPVYYNRPFEITLKPGESKTLKTVVVNQAGRKSVVYAATIIRGKYREPDTATANTPGVTYRFGIPTGENIAQETEGETKGLGLTQFASKSDLKMPFFVGYSGYLKIPADGVYEFQTDSSWGTSVTLGDVKVIPFNEGTAERSVRSTIVPLKAGLHKVTLFYQNKGGEPSFRFRYGIKGQGLRQAYGGEFVH